MQILYLMFIYSKIAFFNSRRVECIIKLFWYFYISSFYYRLILRSISYLHITHIPVNKTMLNAREIENPAIQPKYEYSCFIIWISKNGGKTINCLIRYYFLNSSLQHSQHVLIRLRISTLVTNVNKFGVTVCYSFIARWEKTLRNKFILNIWIASLQFRHLICNFSCDIKICLKLYICTFVTFLSIESMCTPS